MVNANEENESSKRNSISENDVAQSVNAPSTSNMNVGNTVASSGIADNMEESEYEDDGEYEEEDNEEYEDEYEEEEEEVPEEEMVNDGGRALVVVDDDRPNIEEEHKKGKGIVEETNKENAVEENAIKGEDKEKAEEPKNGEELGENSKRKGRRLRNKNKNKAAQKVSATVPTNGDKPESSTKKNASKRVESMGMVFMCSSKTKNDCFRYKILGLPANKKDQVAKIYKGMRLFLFDVDLRLMYGIFKAAGPGGYNIEPKAFKSEFPSQVRFTLLEDCLPVAEEKFRDVLKENYFTRNKFEGLLKAEQVKKLCKLFVGTGKGGPRSRTTIKPRRTGPVETRRVRTNRIGPVETRRVRTDRTGPVEIRQVRTDRTGPVETRRVRIDESRRNRAADDLHASRDRKKRKRRPRVEEQHPLSPSGREKRRYTDYKRSPVLYDREPPVPRYLPPLPPPSIASPVRSYSYERPLDLHPYIRDHVPDPRSYRVLEIDPRHHDELLRRDLDRTRDRDRDQYYVYSREAPVYREPLYNAPPPEYHLVSREYHHPVVHQAEYRFPEVSRVPSYRDVGREADYRSSAALPEYRSHRTHYRY
ncbi:uncharacterized protein LOC112513163 [Cynara cardunculus var. scolymus]|uniref:uncharacterized protein LOC112513163 n=1 Tax=Cynara cardunculus var. scolymus TaxID=59895 RepID=UPI000D624D54|nr:uncharacterized protein LOC112513163 [Cynara cardunculus var. scolymus]